MYNELMKIASPNRPMQCLAIEGGGQPKSYSMLISKLKAWTHYIIISAILWLYWLSQHKSPAPAQEGHKCANKARLHFLKNQPRWCIELCQPMEAESSLCKTELWSSPTAQLSVGGGGREEAGGSGKAGGEQEVGPGTSDMLDSNAGLQVAQSNL